MFKNIFKKNKKNKISNEIEKNEDFINKEYKSETIEDEKDYFEDLMNFIDNEENQEKEKKLIEEEIFPIEKKEKAYNYPNTQNSYFKNSYNDLFHDNLLIYGQENYFANQSIFRVIRENIRNGTGLIWFVNEHEFLNVSEMIKSDSEFFGYKDRVFTAFEIKEDFLEKALLLSHVYIVLQETKCYDDLSELKLDNYKLDFFKIEKTKSDFLPIILSSNIITENKTEKQIKELNKYNISFFIYADSIYNQGAIESYIHTIINHYLVLTDKIYQYEHIENSYIDDELNIHNETRITLVYDKELDKKIKEETKKMKPMESFFINKENIKYIKF